MTIKHTQAPWTAQVNPSNLGDKKIVAADGSIVALLNRPICSANQPQALQNLWADCNLIASAPELLELCKRILISHKTDGAATIGTAHLCRQFELALEDVIARAEGK